MLRKKLSYKTTNRTYQFLIFLLMTTTAMLMMSCVVENAFYEEDIYCMSWCESLHPKENVTRAEWHGNDELIGKTRCACHISLKNGEDITTIHLVDLMGKQ